MEELRELIEAARSRADELGAQMTGIFLDRAWHAVSDDEAAKPMSNDDT